MREIEVCTEVRKTIARMTNRVLDEQLRDRLHAGQQAFVSKRDIVHNHVNVHSAFRAAVQEHNSKTSLANTLLLLLSVS